MYRSLSIGTLCLATLLAGCVGETAGPAELENLPERQEATGSYWHYKASDGSWQNLTVEGAEMFNGFAALRIKVETWQAQGQNRSTETIWVDAKTLGKVGSELPGLSTRASCPISQLLPLTDRDYPCDVTIKTNGQTYEKHYEIHKSVEAAAPLVVPAGRFDAIEIKAINSKTGESLVHGWYAEEAGYLVRLVIESAPQGPITLDLAAYGP